MARGAAYATKPIEKSILKSNPPEASPNLLVNVSMNTVDLYFSFELSVVYTASRAGLFNPYSNGLITPCKIKKIKTADEANK